MIDHDLAKGDSDEAVAFLDNMFPNLPRHLVAIELDNRVRAGTFLPQDRIEMHDRIEARQGESNQYFHVNALRSGFVNKKATKGDVSAALSLHVDVDDLDAEKRLREFSPPPTAIVFSGGGYQAYWKLKEPSADLARVEAANRAIAKHVGGDNCHNIDRIMRLPGTINIPNAKKQAAGRTPTVARVVEADWLRTYSLDEFPQDDGSETAVNRAPNIVPVHLDELPLTVSKMTRTIIEQGDDPEWPRGSQKPRFQSRSEGVFRVSIDLARTKCTVEVIAGVLINPQYGISASILDKRQPIAYALRQARAAHAAVENGWPDPPDKLGRPRATMRNALVALQKLELSFGFDLFRHRKVLNGALLQDFEGELSDDVVTMVRALIIDTFSFDPKAEHVRDALNQLCLENSFHPVRDMLDALEWDGIARLDTWLIDFLGAEDTPLNRTIGSIMLIAAVRRVRDPGVKFDQIVILEGPQGSGKSSALRILAGEGLHSDQEILNQDARTQMELLQGTWFYELCEVEGMNRAEVNKIKAFASRQEDRSRMAYGRFVESRPRQAICVGTTNETTYLRDQTGNRRFWPVKTGTIDLEKLRWVRDQLLAEASHRERLGESILLPPNLWEAAALQQAARLEEDPWLERLSEIRGKAFGGVVRVATGHLIGHVLGIPTERQNQGHSKRLATLMRKLGWKSANFRIGDRTVRGYERQKPEGHVDPQEF